MPFKRKTLTELREQNQNFLRNELKEPGALLRYSNMRVLADMDAGMAHLHYAYLDYIAKQSTPFTATDEYLAGWGALKRVYRKPPNKATCKKVQFDGVPDSTIPAGTTMIRGDGYRYQSVAETRTNADGKGFTSVEAILPGIDDNIHGGGAAGNSPAGTKLTLEIAISGVSSECIAVEPITGGSDIENEEAFRQRVLHAYQKPPQGGSDTDYDGWAKEVPGISRAWVKRRLLGAGSVGIYIMCDGNSNGGFPLGTDGPATKETYAVHASGDQLRVADHIWDVQTVTALVWVCSPIAKKIDFEIEGLNRATSELHQQIAKAIDDVFFRDSDPTGGAKIYLSDLQYAIADIPGTTGFVLKKPAENIVLSTGELAQRGEVSYT
ncbi:baseplate J/gp47 family protein [Morganella morganii]|uniref:baseplate J/gp47 family protein n=1 Tax=Morganella morganii TaxID=582 RepID=UPI000BD65EF6|nr:baseplate J/gp47 family protein [Morganella morganii]PCO28273.1 phage baseplate protein [Morganella morganii]